MRNRVIEWWRKNPAMAQAGIAILALLLGILVYMLDRDPGQVYFLPDDFALPGTGAFFFGPMGNYLPDFLHVYAFILLTCAALRPGKTGVLFITVFWMTTDVLFEAGQHPSLAPLITEHIPAWFAHVPFLENTRLFFSEGHFDPLDLVAFILGAMSAYATVTFMPAYDRSG